MNNKLTAEQLNAMSQDAVTALFLQLQDQLAEANEKLAALSSRLDKLTEQIALANASRYGRRTEKLSAYDGQLSFDADGHIYFNETEAIADSVPEPSEEAIETLVRKVKKARPSGKKEQDLKGFEVIQLPTHDVPEEDLIREFGSLDNCMRLPDVVYSHLAYIPAGWRVEEEHVAVYCSRHGERRFLKGETPAYLLRGSYVSPSLEAAVINAKFVNSAPYRRIEADFKRNGIPITEQNMAYWTTKCSERYLTRLTDYLKKLLTKENVLHADETTLEVVRDGRKAGSKSYMWVYRTAQSSPGHPIILYDYQKTRHHEHPLKFLSGFKGTLVCDGFPGYKTLAREADDIKIAECWTHARRKFMDAIKGCSGPSTQGRIAEDAVRMIAGIYSEDNKLKDLSAEERQKARNKKVRPLVDAYFTWLKSKAADKTILMSDLSRNGVNYSINQEPHLRAFLEDGNIPLDNNQAERAIRNFTIGRKNFMTIDTVSGAKASAVIYGLVETAKANDLNPYYYFKYLLEELPKLKEFISEEEEAEAMQSLLPWSPDLPEKCHSRGRH